MKIVKIVDGFYRVCDKNGACKDVRYVDGIIQEPEQEYNILTEEEKDFLMEYLMNE